MIAMHCMSMCRDAALPLCAVLNTFHDTLQKPSLAQRRRHLMLRMLTPEGATFGHRSSPVKRQ